MIKINHIKLLSLASLFSLCVSCADTTKSTDPTLAKAPTTLKVGEGFTNPLGYYESTPRFSWQLPAEAQSKNQTAYQIQVASSTDAFLNTPDFWDSKKVSSSQNAWIRYQGKPLTSRQKVYWRVRSWNEQDKASGWSAIQSLELGLLSKQEWQAKWIGHPDTQLDKKPSQALLATPQYLRKSFFIKGEVKQARLYITAKGLFKPYINGSEVSAEDVMTPGWTPYAKRIESLTYDLTSQLIQGENTLASSLAGGWYSGRVYKFTEKEHKLPPRLLAQLEITYQDGTVQTVVTDKTWLTTQQGPIRFASIYDGEKYEQANEMPGWTTTRFNAQNWQPAIENVLDENVEISPKQHAPIRITETLAVQEIVSDKDGIAIFDFGQNMVGVPALNIPVIAGQEVKIRYAEALHQGEFYTDNYRSAESTNYYLPNKTGMINYQPTFTYHGYRYVEVSGFDRSKKANKDWITALVQHSDVKIHANFKSSHDKLNKLSENIVWGLRSNFFDIPLDCPQRDERLGWTGDAQVFVTPSMYMADVYGFWAAWLKSIREEQAENGKIPLYIPFVDWINFASSGWGDAVTIIPWELYTVTGDKAILADNYEMMTKWLNYHQIQSKDHVSNMMTFGDWLQPYPVAEGKKANRGDTDYALISTAYYAHSVQLTINAAKVLGKQQDVIELTALHAKIKNAFNQHFFDAQLNLKAGIPTQTTYLLGLAYDLFTADKHAIAVEKLIGLIKSADNHLRTGFLGTPLLTQVLQNEGRSDVIYDLLFKETYPSWFYSINNGATTTWERWNSYTLAEGFNPQGMNSLNHYAYGTISRWFYEGILGIKPAEAGFTKINIEPQFGTQLTQASGQYNTPQGEVNVEWSINNKQLSMTVVIPKNTTADIYLPKIVLSSFEINQQKQLSNRAKDLQPGTYIIKGELNAL